MWNEESQDRQKGKLHGQNPSPAKHNFLRELTHFFTSVPLTELYMEKQFLSWIGIYLFAPGPTEMTQQET